MIDQSKLKLNTLLSGLHLLYNFVNERPSKIIKQVQTNYQF